MNSISLLDGAMGTEFIRLGIDLPEHIWSAHMNLFNPDLVRVSFNLVNFPVSLSLLIIFADVIDGIKIITNREIIEKIFFIETNYIKINDLKSLFGATNVK